MADDLEKTTHSITAHKGHFTRHVQTLAKAVSFLDKSPSEFAKSEVQDELAKIKHRKQVLDDLYEHAQSLDEPDKQKSYENKLAELATLYDNAVDPAFVAIHQAAQIAARGPMHAPPVAGAQGGGDQTFKVQTALQPQKLMRDSTPSELSSWVDKFRAFYSVSKLERATLPDQQAFLIQCLDLDLETYLKQHISDTTEIFGDDSCMSLLQEKFLKIYPIFSRRLDFFRFSQAPGQKASDFYTKLRQKGNEANLSGLDIDQQYVFRIICGLTDSRLKGKLLKLVNPDLDEVLEEIELYEIANKALKDLEIHKPTEIKYVKMKDVKGRCFGCGGDEIHKDRKICPAFGHECKGCGRRNHFSRMCFGPDWKPKKKEYNKTPGPTRTSSPTRAKVSECAETKAVHVDDVDIKMMEGWNQPTPLMDVIIAPEDNPNDCFTIKALPDTGASSSIISFDIVQERNWENWIWSHRKINLRAANGSSMPCKGSLVLRVEIPNSDKRATIEVIVSTAIEREFLLSWHHLKQLGVIHDLFPACVEVNSLNNDNDIDLLSKGVDKLREDFSDVLADSLGQAAGGMYGPPAKIHLREDPSIKPQKVFTARQTPIHLKEAADSLIKELLEAGVIVPEHDVTDWVSPGHFVIKPGSNPVKARLVTDYRILNKLIKRPVHPFASASDIIRQIRPDSKWFAKIDAIHSYYQVKLDDESSKLTTFLLPSGKYRYTACPMGMSMSSDLLVQRLAKAFEGLDWILNIVDDGLIQAPTQELLLERLEIVLERCRKEGIKLSKKKLSWGQEVPFAGHIVGAEGIKPDPSKIDGIRNFPTPQNVTQLRSFLGLANTLAAWMPDLSQCTVRMRSLLKKKNAFVWTESHDKEFQTAKDLLCSDKIVKPFDPTLKTLLLTDASRLHGIGFALIQTDEDDRVRLIECSSTSLNDAQKNYATIELEGYAVKWSINKCKYYLQAIPYFQVISDHRPLTGIFTKNLADLSNVRLTSYRENLSDFNFDVVWVPGKTHILADSLSRNPVLKEDVEINKAIAFKIESTPHLDKLIQFAESDKVYQTLIQQWKSGHLDNKIACLTPYKGIWDDLSLLENGLLAYQGTRLVVPPSAYRHILDLLHIPHSGITKTRANAQDLFYWPGYSNDIKQMIENCRICQKHLPSQPLEPFCIDPCTFPMERVHADLFDFHNKFWLIIVDKYSGFPFVEQLKNGTTESVTAQLDKWFLEFGYPTGLISDNGPAFRDKFKEWTQDRGIIFDTSSPYNSQANGQAESVIKSIKKLLYACFENNEDFRLALLEFRNCPRLDGFSPSMAFYGRRLQGKLPFIPSPMQLVEEKGFSEKRLSEKEKISGSMSKKLPTLAVNDQVLIQHPITKLWDRTGTIIDIVGHESRSYLVEPHDGGAVIRRNRRFLRPTNISHEIESPESSHPASQPPLRRSERLKSKKSVSFQL